MTAPRPRPPADVLRIGDLERDAAAARLQDHFAEGRLSLDELHQRLDATLAARTAAELERVTRDLPDAAATARRDGPHVSAPDWQGWRNSAGDGSRDAGPGWSGHGRAGSPWGGPGRGWGGPPWAARRRRGGPPVFAPLLVLWLAALTLGGGGIAGHLGRLAVIGAIAVSIVTFKRARRHRRGHGRSDGPWTRPGPSVR